MDEEHFFTTDMLSLIAGSASPSKDPEAEKSNREQASRAPSAPSTSTSGDSSPAPLRPSRGKRGICPERLPLPRKGTGSAPRVLKIKKRDKSEKEFSGAQVKDFLPWVCPEPSWPFASEEEEGEEEITGLLDRYAARKRKRQEDAEREADRAEGSSWVPTDEGLEMQAIVIMGSLKMGSSDQLGLEDVVLEELREDVTLAQGDYTGS